MTRREHIRQFADLLGICDRLIERVIEIMRNEDCEVRVVGFQFFV